MKLLRRKPFLGIREKMILCCILSTIITIVFSDLVVYWIYQKDITEKEFFYMEDGNQILSDNIDNLISTIEEKLVTELEYCTVFSYQDDLSNLYVADVMRSLKRLVTLMKMRGTNVKSIYILDQYTCSYYYDTKEELLLDDFKEKSVYQEIRDNHKTMFPRQGSTLWRSFPDNPDEIYLIKHYINSETTDYKGIVCLTFDKDYFHTLLGEHDFSSIIYDEKGYLLYCSEDLRYAMQCKDNSVRDQYLISSTSVGKRGWTLEALVNKSTILARTKSLASILLIVELVVLIGVIAMIAYLFRGMLGNILALDKSFRDINAGKPVEQIIPRTRDETAYLCQQFNTMYGELNQSVEKMAQDSTLRERAEYNALLAQMNPHFLYNTLESISSMAKLSGQEDIVHTIHMLGYLLRASINGNTQKIPLQKELLYIRYYLELQKLVTGGRRLDWDISIEPGTEQYLVPKLLLQPVVENSIIHGLHLIKDDCIIVITSGKKKDCLILEVYDNGEGTNQEEIDRILSEDGQDDSGNDRAHIGIRSIQKRLHILYGPEYGMQMESSPGNGMIVRITLPLEKCEEENV